MHRARRLSSRGRRLDWRERCPHFGVTDKIPSDIVNTKESTRMRPTIILCSLLLFSAFPAFAQTVRIEGVAEPSELTGEPKKVKQPSEADKQLFELMKDVKDNATDAEARAVVQKMDEFLKNFPDYSDVYFLRATYKACIQNNRDFDSITSDIKAAMSRPAQIYNDTDYYSLLGKIALAQAQHEEALRDLEKAMKRDFDSADKMFNIEGVELERTSKFCAWNLTDLDGLVAKFPNNYLPWLFRGLYYEFFTTFKEDYYPKAMKEFQKASILKPSSPLPPYFIGQLYSKASFWTKKAWASDQGRDQQVRNAAQAYTTAVRLDPKFLPAYEHRASDYLNLKQYQQALRDYETVLTLDPENSVAYSDRGLAWFETGRYVAAIADFGDAIRRKKDEDSYLPDLFEHRGDAYSKVGDYRNAIADYTKAIELRFGSLTILLNLKQIRGLYPEYDRVPDDILLRKIHDMFWPNMEYAGFVKQLEQNGSWGISLVNELYEKRGDAYLKAGDFGRGVLDFKRIFRGIPNFAASTDRWRSLGKAADGEYFLDVKSAEFAANEPVRFWIKTIKKKGTENVAYEMDCKGRRLSSTSSITYDASGNVVSSSDVSSGWQRVVPDSIGEQLLNGACSPTN